MFSLSKEIIAECRSSSPGLCFISLLGNDSGDHLLPFVISEVLFERLVAALTTEPERAELLLGWYARDDNADPPVYAMLRDQVGLLCRAAIEAKTFCYQPML